MEPLLEQLRQESQNNNILSKFQRALEKRWKAYGPELLHSYDIATYGSKVFSTVFVAISAASVDADPPEGSATLANFRLGSWLTVKWICSNIFGIFLCKSQKMSPAFDRK